MPPADSGSEATLEDVIKADAEYYQTVYLFVTIYEILNRKNIKCQIEHDITNCSGRIVRPDFLLLSDSNVGEIIEHKASLNASFAEKELEDIIQKYECVKWEERTYNPQVIGLIPVDLLKIVEKIRDEKNLKIFLSGFAVNLDIYQISFEMHDNPKNSLVSTIFNDVIEFDPKRLAEFRFIKAEPKYITYTAFFVWTILKMFYDPYIANNNYFEVDFDKVSKRAMDFFPSWIRNNRQLASSRIRRALKFLDKINFVDWKEGNKTIRVYYSRGTKVHEVWAYFREKYVELQKKKKKQKNKKASKTKQLTLFS